MEKQGPRRYHRRPDGKEREETTPIRVRREANVSEIRDFVMQEPLFDNHEHQQGFTSLQERKDSMDYREFAGYANADIATAAGVG